MEDTDSGQLLQSVPKTWAAQDRAPLLGLGHTINDKPLSLNDLSALVGSVPQSANAEEAFAALGYNFAPVSFAHPKSLDPSVPKGTSAASAGLSIAKCVVGAASFYLPAAFAAAGTLGSAVGLVLLAALTTYCNALCIRLKTRLVPDAPSSYYDITIMALGKAFGWGMYVSIIIANIGSCATYYVFCAQLMARVIPGAQLYQIVLVIAFIECVLSWAKEFRYLAWTAVVGDIALLFAVGVVLGAGAANNGFTKESLPLIVINTYPTFFGAASFLFVIPSLLFPIHNAMRKPKQFEAALIVSFSVVTVLNLAFAMICYYIFGSHVDDVVLNSIVGDKVWVNVAQVALAVDLIFTFVVVFLPPRDIIEQTVFGAAHINTNVAHWKRMVVRTLLIFATAGIAIGIPDISALIGLVSGLSGSYNAFIVPPIIYLKLRKKDRTEKGEPVGAMTVLSWVAHIGIVVFGLVAGGLTTAQAIQSVVQLYSGKSSS